MKQVITYRDIRAELNEIIEWFERSDDIDIDEAVAQYEKAKALIAQLESYLTAIEDKINQHTSTRKTNS